MPRARRLVTADTPADLSAADATRVVAARVPVDLADAWRSEAEASGMCMSDWLRQAVDPDRVDVVGARQPRRRRLEADPRLLAHLGRLGNNLNQLARLANRGALAEQPVPVLQVLAVIERHLARLAER